MRIISLNLELEHLCEHCNCRFAYTPKDIEFDSDGKCFVRCPNCSKKLYVEPSQWFIDRYKEYVDGLKDINRKIDF